MGELEIKKSEETKTAERLDRFFIASVESVPSENHPERNEDTVIFRPDLGLFAVFDGLGGHEAGNEASREAAKTIEECIEEETKNGAVAAKEEWLAALKRAFVKARQRLQVLRGEIGEGRKRNLDTTASVAKIVEENGKIFLIYESVGDSRIYLRYGKRASLTERLTEDDDAVRARYPAKAKEIQRLLDVAATEKNLYNKVDVGGGLPPVELRYFFYSRNMISQTLAGQESRPDNFQSGIIEVKKGDVVIITSDGVHDNLTLSEIRYWADILGGEGGKLAHRLVELAKERSRDDKILSIRSKPDDMSAIAVEVK